MVSTKFIVRRGKGRMVPSKKDECANFEDMYWWGRVK